MCDEDSAKRQSRHFKAIKIYYNELNLISIHINNILKVFKTANKK